MLVKLTLALAACLLAAPADDTKDKKGPLEGTWVVVAATRDGKPHDEIKEDKLVIEGEMITIKTKNKDEKATFKVDAKKKPAELDLTPEGAPGSLKAIYQVEGDTLKICAAHDPEGARPTTFESKEGSGLMLVELKREKK
jgi:uncharacterized protein (TIGR03067 family)